MYKILKNLLLAVMVLCSVAAMAQGGATSQMTSVTGTIYSADYGTPLANIMVSSRDAMSGVVSGPDGKFEIEVRDGYAHLTISSKGYFTQSVELMGRKEITIFLQDESRVMSADAYLDFTGEHFISEKVTASTAINKKDIGEGYTTIDNALAGRFAGLNIINKGGSLGEGSYYATRGLRSLVAENAPLIVVDGVPVLVDDEVSTVVSGFSNNVFEVVNTKEIESVTYLKGADAAMYGSLGSNGVLFIETEQGIDQETQVEVSSVNGVSFLDKSLPMMNALSYRNYVSELASTVTNDDAEYASLFPFMTEISSGIDSYKYLYDTDWQDLIYSPAFTTDNALKVKGGDAAVKFMLSVGYQNSEGVVDGTSMNKISTRGNTNIAFNPKLNAYASVAFNYRDMNVQEQGMTSETNPTLAAYDQMPLLDVYLRNVNGTLTNSFSQVESTVGASNPVAILSGVSSSIRSYDMLINTGINYDPNRYLSFDIRFGINYSYTKDDIFIGGRTSGAIAPLEGGLALNTVRSGSSEAKGYYVNGNMNYNRTFSDLHNISVDAAYQMMFSTTTATVGKGINTANDTYTNLSKVSSDAGKESWGYINLWNWMSGVVSAGYTYNSQLYVGASVLGDAASTYGVYSDRLFFYPSANVGWRAKNSNWLQNNHSISNFTVRGDYSIIPNSRFDSSYGLYYYELDMLSDISGIVRAGIPNQDIEPEEVHSINVGADLGLAKNKFSLSLDAYQEETKNMIVEEAISPVYGFNSVYDNTGAIRTRGLELAFSASIINRADFQWIVSGTIATYKSKILSLGSSDYQITTVEDDVTLINEVGSSPYEFYGLVAEGVYSTTAEAEADGLVRSGGYAYEAGDVKYSDLNHDGIINDSDKTYLGSAIPDFYGGIQTRLKYGKFSLYANFTYSYGNDAYNGVRRYNESGSSFTNQSVSLERRWMREGDVTDIPKVTYGDPAGNNDFSSRWIEDASYIKLKELTFSYEHKRKWLFFNSVNIFVTAENLITFTKYTGLDPEFSYSYDTSLLGMDLAKVALPTTIKLGLVLNF